MSLKKILLGFSVMAMFISMNDASDVLLTKKGSVHFISEAPLETIEASNDLVGAVLNRNSRTVAFQVPIVGFEGFNSALQHEHFNENYMETDAYPKATFSGKIIEDVNLFSAGSHKVRAKGMLTIHGIEQERIIPGTISIKGDAVSIKADFDVTLADHEISIPRIVTQKIAEVVSVELNATLKPKA